MLHNRRTAIYPRLRQRNLQTSGESESVIIVGAHFDFAELGEGIVDDWSGAALLPSLYEALRTIPRKYKFVVAAFAEEETGLNGSSRYVKELTAGQRSRVRAFINSECLGLGKTKVWASRATPSLSFKLTSIANAIHEGVHAVNVERIGDDDSHPFLSAHLPVITLHSLSEEALPFCIARRIQSMRNWIDRHRGDAAAWM